MNPSAANCLLKLLEEPPSHALIVLTAIDPARLLQTICSRCAPLALEPVPVEKLAPWLASKMGADPAQAEIASRIAEGRPGFALSILKSDALSHRREILDELKILKRHGFASVFRVADRLGTIGKEPEATLNMTILLLRDCLSVSMGLDGALNRDLEDDLRDLAEGLSPTGLLGAAGLVAEAVSEVYDFYTPQSKAHFMEALVTGIGQELKKNPDSEA